MSSTSLSKEFFELIKAIGESKSKQEEDRIIQDEVKNLKQLLQDMKSSSRRMKEVLIRLVYVEMLGHNASWGYVVAVQQTATSDLPQKRAGYLACSLMLSPDHEFRFMLVNQMQRDLASANVLECSAALVAACKLVTSEMTPALLPKITELLTHDNTIIRKKAVMALHRCHQLDPPSIAHLHEQVKALLRDRDPAVMAAALCLLHELARADPASQSDLVDQYVSILKQITEHRLPRDFDYHRMPAPWVQIKLLQLLATLGANDKRASESMYEVLGECMKRADTGTNIGYAVVYEAVKTITSIWPDTSLLDAAASAISRFVQSDAYNLKYLGVTGLAAIVRDHPRYAVQHQMAVIDCLEDPDETLKRKTLELLFRMTNPQNAEAVVEKLLTFLDQAVDPFLRQDLVTRVVQLADRYAPTNLWFVETMIRLFLIAGDLANAEANQNLLRLLAEGVEQTDEDEDQTEQESAKMRRKACYLLFDALQKSNLSEVLMKCAFWALGEYGYLLSTPLANGHKKKKKQEEAEDDVLRVEEEEEEEEVDDPADLETIPLENILISICETVDRATVVDPSTRAYGVSTISKITAQLGHLIPRAKQSLEKHAMSRHTELQQRCREFLFLTSDMSRLSGLFPVDASCEDFDNVDFSFFNEFTDILRAAGAPEYQERLKVVNDYDFEPGFHPESSPNQSVANGGKAPASKLRFDAYEPPKLYENTISPMSGAAAAAVAAAASTGTAGSLDYNMDDLAKLVSAANVGASIAAAPVAPPKPNVKSVWGPKGYMGSLPSLGGGAPPPPSSPSAPSPASSASQPTATLQPTYQNLTPDYDFGGATAATSDQMMEDLRPPPPPPKPELSDKERAAQALFGGLGGKAASKSAKQATSSARPAPTAQQQPQTKKAPSAPPPDLFSMDSDLLGVGSTSISSFSAPSPNPTTSTTDSLFDLFSSPAPPPAQPTPSPSMPAAPVLAPHQMDTAHFGSLWPSHAAEMRLSVKASSSNFQSFLQRFSAVIGASLVEFIPATQEAIFAGDASAQDTVLLHTKDAGSGNVDVMVRSRQSSTTDKVVQACRKAFF